MNEQNYCSVSKKCSGCQLSNMDYTRQLKYKQNQLRIRFNRLCSLNRIIGADSPTAYRNKAQFVFRKLKGKVRCGIYQSADKTIILTDSCALHTPQQNSTARTLCRLFDSFRIEPYDFYRHTGTVKSVFVRQSFHTGELMVVIVCDSNSRFPSKDKFVQALVKEVPAVASVILTTHRGSTLHQGDNPKVIYGSSHITDRICGLNFIISYNSFFQINPKQTEKLYSTAISMADLTPEDTVLDAYCGTGTIGLVSAGSCKKVYSVELNENAVRDAHKNAKLNSISNAEIVCADSKDYIEYLRQENTPLSCAILDPPRAGCSRSFLNSLSALAPERIVYISCNIDTQLRDIRYMMKRGYKPINAQGVDMFPYTKHIESVVLLCRTDKVKEAQSPEKDQ